MSDGIVMIVNLFIHPGQEQQFTEFEMRAARIMRRFGGSIDCVIRPYVSPHGVLTPHEIHVVSFPSMEQFEAYRADPELATLAPLRQAAIVKTEITIGQMGANYPNTDSP